MILPILQSVFKNALALLHCPIKNYSKCYWAISAIFWIDAYSQWLVSGIVLKYETYKLEIMKKLTLCTAICFSCFFISNHLNAQEGKDEVVYVKMAKEKKKNAAMKTYLIEREIPEAGNLTQDELKGISQKSCSVLKEMGEGIEWLHSYVTGDKVYCLYRAKDEALIRTHAEMGGFPVNSIQELSTKIGPETANK